MPRGLASLVGCLGHSAALASGKITQGVGFTGGEGGEVLFHHSSLERTANRGAPDQASDNRRVATRSERPAGQESQAAVNDTI